MPTVTINSDDVRLQWREVIENVGKVDTIVTRYRKPTAVVIDYETWLGMQEEMEDFRTRQRIQEAIDEWSRDPSTARPWAEIQQEMIAEGLLDAA